MFEGFKIQCVCGQQLKGKQQVCFDCKTLRRRNYWKNLTVEGRKKLAKQKEIDYQMRQKQKELLNSYPHGKKLLTFIEKGID